MTHWKATTLRRPRTLRARLTLWYVTMLAALLVMYAALVFAFQYVALTRQLYHDEVQDVVTVEGLLYFAQDGSLQLSQNYLLPASIASAHRQAPGSAGSQGQSCFIAARHYTGWPWATPCVRVKETPASMNA